MNIKIHVIKLNLKKICDLLNRHSNNSINTQPYSRFRTILFQYNSIQRLGYSYLEIGNQLTNSWNKLKYFPNNLETFINIPENEINNTDINNLLQKLLLFDSHENNISAILKKCDYEKVIIITYQEIFMLVKDTINEIN